MLNGTGKSPLPRLPGQDAHPTFPGILNPSLEIR